MNNILKPLSLIGMALGLAMCSRPKLPETSVETGRLPRVSPDYTELSIPVNIAPLNFSINEKGKEFVTRFRTKDGEGITVGGKVLDTDINRWHELLAKAQGDTIYADVYVRTGEGWKRYAPIRYFVGEEIDPYISYRFIEPLYLNYKVLKICQRNMENFDESDIYNNSAFLDTDGDRQCMNCHSFQDYNRGGNMQMHIRVVEPGTVIVRDGEISKVNLKTDATFSPGAYPSWHPTHPLIAYSINDTWQHFHSVHHNKVEVQDAASGLILYDADANTVSIIADSPTELETFPYWSADGKTLYYASATVPELDKTGMANYRIDHYKDIKYNLYKKSFDPETKTFGATDTVFMASDSGKSATLPRESPDGRFLMFTMGEFGTFHIFHDDADLYMMDTATGEFWPLEKANGDNADSYHSWSSNGRWVIFSSRRDNGSYTRFYITRIDDDGNASKAFILPQKSPFAGDMLFKSYNVPEFMVNPVSVNRKDLTDAVKRDAVQAKFK